MTNALKIWEDYGVPIIGRNPFFDIFNPGEKYPPHNEIKTDSGYLIEIAVPGWTREDLKVSFESNVLKVMGEKRVLEEGADYVYKALSTKAFTRSWVVDRDLKVGEIYLKNGLLTIELYKDEYEEPAEKFLPIH